MNKVRKGKNAKERKNNYHLNAMYKRERKKKKRTKKWKREENEEENKEKNKKIKQS